MKESKSNRRQFLEIVGVSSIVAGTAGARASRGDEAKEKLAIDGGTPVRKNLLGYQAYGPQYYNEVEKRELLEVLESRRPFRWWKNGSKALEFEEAYAAHIGVKYAIGVTSGTTALAAALAALEIGPGDEVILPAWTWYADYDTIVLAGALPALPVFARSIVHSTSTQPTSRQESRRVRKRSSPSSLQGCPDRHGSNPRNREKTPAPRPGGLLPMRGRTLSGQVPRLDGRHRHQQLPAGQDHHGR